MISIQFNSIYFTIEGYQIIKTHFIENQELIENLSTLCTNAISDTFLEFKYDVLKLW